MNNTEAQTPGAGMSAAAASYTAGPLDYGPMTDTSPLRWAVMEDEEGSMPLAEVWSEGDARMMAAAPDLFEALLAMVNHDAVFGYGEALAQRAVDALVKAGCEAV